MNHRLITNPSFFENEAALINELFELGLPCLHLRKPESTALECARLLEQLNPGYYQNIMIHQHPALVNQFDLMGFHLKEGERQNRSEAAVEKMIHSHHLQSKKIGTSVHQKTTLDQLSPNFDYVFVSPVFSSISKQQYEPTIDWTIQQQDYEYKIVALGGICLETLNEAKKKGFGEVALLGAVWGDLTNVVENYKQLLKGMMSYEL